jgi:hypothetical protein
MELVCEYASQYGGVPDERLSFWLFLGMVQRTGRFHAREVLRVFDGVRLGAAPLVSTENRMMVELEVEDLKKQTGT